MSEKKYCVYIITNVRDSVLYTGVTGDLVRRIYQHRNKLVQGFSSKYNLKKLVYYEIHNNPNDAIRREKQIKNLVRRKKNKLIDDFNFEWNDLYDDLVS